MKRIALRAAGLAAAFALGFGIMTPAQAADPFGVTLSKSVAVQAGDRITVTITGLTGSVGVYTSVCKQGATAQALPTLCDKSTETWITADGLQGSSKQSAVFTANATFTGVNCLVDACVLYVRGDHNNSKDFSLVRTPALAFVGGGVAKLKDTVTATVNGQPAIANVPGTLQYRTPITLAVTTASGLPVTLVSLNGNCAVDGTQVTALSATGLCAIAAQTTGNDKYAALSAAVNFPFYLAVAKPTIRVQLPIKKLTLRKPVALPADAFTSSLGSDLPVKVLSASGSFCTVRKTESGWSVWPKRVGVCMVRATTAEEAGKWELADLTVSLPISAK